MDQNLIRRAAREITCSKRRVAIIGAGILVSFHQSETTQVIFIIDTSTLVDPAASLRWRPKECGATIIEINKDPTDATKRLSEHLICGSPGKIIPEIVKEIQRLQC